MEILLWFNSQIFIFLVASALLGLLLAKFLPTPKQQLLELLFLVVVVISSFALGMHRQEQQLEASVKDLKHQLALAKQKGETVNEVVKTKVVVKTKIIRENLNAHQEIIKQTAAEQINNSCQLPISSIMLHNTSSQNTLPQSPGSIDGTPSGIEASRLLETVIENYAACHQNAMRLQAWQDWYRQQEKILSGIE